MSRKQRILLKIAFVLAFVATSLSAHSQELKTINPSGGGMIMYGQIAGQTTEAGAMGHILKNLHQNLGEKPQVGKLFAVKGTQSVAAFFSIDRHDQGAGKPKMHVAGLIIATKVSTDHVEAAIVSDEASRFPKTVGPLTKTLFASWHPLQGGGESGPATGAGPAPLHQITLQDNSAMVSLPQGWQLARNISAMGSIAASGPDGDTVELGIAYSAMDTNNRSTQQTLQTLRQGGLRNTSYATATYVPWGGDLARTYEYMIQGERKKANLPAAIYKFTSVTPAQSNSQTRCVHMVGTVDLADNKGLREINGLFCEDPPSQYGSFLAISYTTMAPMQVAAKERATLGAILASFQVNQQVVSQQAAAIAAPAIEQIHAIGRAAAAQAKASHEAFEIHNSSVYKQWDTNDKRSQEFENYQLGYSVIANTEDNSHGTFWDSDAEAIVKSNPQKYEYVNAPNYWKGIDY